jgi:hypothetical protein
MNSRLEDGVPLGSRQLVFVQLLIWIVATGFLINIFLRHAMPGLAWLALLAFGICLTFVVSQFTFGVVGQSGLRYWRIWGWQRLRWNEIEKFEDRFRLNGVVAVLRDAPGWRRRLDFRGNSMLFRQETIDKQRELVESLNERCRESK